MIDYEKLKLAVEICSNSLEYYFRVEFCARTNSDKLDIYLMQGDEIEQSFSSLDDLIAKLHKLTKPEPKYQVGDEVFYEVNNKIKQSRIQSVYPNPDGKIIWYTDELNQMQETDLFPTRQSLIEHQLQYWKKLYNEELKVIE